MLHATLPVRPWMPPRRSRRQAIERGWLRSWAALLIMLLAVIPHATLKAQSGHDRGPRIAASAMQHAAMTAPRLDVTETAPCHENTADPPPMAHAMPACCVIGCTAILATPAPEFTIAAPSGRRIPVAPEASGRSMIAEPAERPPKNPA